MTELETTNGATLDSRLVINYFKVMVNHFFKILPLKESGDTSLMTYMQSFQSELLGCKELISELQNDAQFLSLLAILQFLIDTPECSVTVLRREVFRAISICNKLEARYASMQSEVSKNECLG